MARRPRVDFQGFKPLINRIRSMIHNNGKAYVFYSKGQGFKCKSKSFDPESHLNDENLSLVGCYAPPIDSNDIIDDLKHELSLQVNTRNERKSTKQ